MLALFLPTLQAEEEVDFSRDILPILSNNCFACHGPDEAERKAGLRLDLEEGAFLELKSKQRGIVKGDSSKSAVFQRLITDDPDDRMPPKETGKQLSKKEIALIKKWIDSGAKWGKHWAFVAPKKSSVPKKLPQAQAINEVDLFIQMRLKALGLSQEAEADRATLIRRLTLDLTGLPPTVQEIEKFLNDKSKNAYERVVDRLLASERYGEHMARIWLDAARYADTHGLHLDNERGIWPYRDWVINSFNKNQPFDQFTIEQLAGDLLPNSTVQQKVATGFNRCNVTTGEGGSIDAEYYVRYAVERVETTSTVWLGLTAGCSSCHDHKFDPMTQKDFYQLFSYFYSLTEAAMDRNVLYPPPSIKAPTAEQIAQQEKLNKDLQVAQKNLQSTLISLKYEDPHVGQKLDEIKKQDRVWFDDKLPEGAKPSGNELGNSWKFVDKIGKEKVFSGKNASVRTAAGLSQHFFTDAKNKLVIGKNDSLFAYVYLDPKNPPETVQLQFNAGSWEHRAFWGADKGHAPGRNNHTNLRFGKLPELGKWVRLEVPAEKVGLKPGAQLNGWAFTQYGGTVYWDKAGIVTVAPLSKEQLESLSIWEQYQAKTQYTQVPGPISAILKIQKDKRSKDQTTQLTRYYLEHVNPSTQAKLAQPRQQQETIKKKLSDIQKAIPSTLIMEDRKTPRQAYILERGEYTLKREKVDSKTPDWIAPVVKDQPANRLGLAKWLVQKDHPLTSRVTVNRFWQQLFGTGLVKTSEDFGVQGEHPTHPELLDWLSVNFIETGWDMKRFMKMLVMSATYRQSSIVQKEKLAKDPENRFYARGARFRLDAEVIRDQALRVSGLLVGTIGGKSVKPYQPPNLWKPVGFGGSNTSVFRQDKGDKLYRRSMYTFWKRTSPPPSMSTFDAPDRETCQVRRARTNTPLQALVLMNDVQFVEAARKFAERVMKEGGKTVEERLVFAFRSTLTRNPSAKEQKALLALYNASLKDYQKDKAQAVKLLSVGESPRDPSLNPEELASWTMVTHLILNLSETVTKG